MIGNAHLDAAWLWQWPEAFQAAKATFRSALDRMREYPELVFTASSAAYHEWIERSDPAMFAEIRERVREGRWQIVGGWWVEAGCNVPSGESLVRQGLVGQRWFATHLGRPATVGFNPDAFGHAASLPAILRGQGMDAYLFLRPQPHERDLPEGPFRWRSADGSEVIALRIPFEYCAPRAALDRQLEQVLERLGDGWREHVMFARQVEALVAPGDVVVAITTSGRSGNVLRGLAAAHGRGATTVALSGSGGGKAALIADRALVVPSDSTARVQEMHGLLIHLVCERLDEELLGRESR